MRPQLLLALFQLATPSEPATRPGYSAAIGPYEQATGLPDMATGPHVRGEREIRVWIGFGMIWPLELYRLVERDGKVTGQYFRIWQRGGPREGPDSSDFAALMRYDERGRCGHFRRSPDAESCVARFVAPPPWSKIWRIIDTLGVWLLPDASTLKGERPVLDGWGLAAETWDGTRYRAWSYSNPQVQPWPEAKRAKAIAEAFALVGPLQPSAEQRRYRGRILSRADSLEFWPCEGGGPWLVEGMIDSLIARTGRGDSSLPYRVTTPYFLDLHAVPAPEFVARDSWHLPERYAGVLQVDSLKDIHAWASEWCRR